MLNFSANPPQGHYQVNSKPNGQGQSNGVVINIVNPNTDVDSPSVNSGEAGPVLMPGDTATDVAMMNPSAFSDASFDSVGASADSNSVTSPSGNDSSAGINTNANTASLADSSEGSATTFSSGTPEAHLMQAYQGVQQAYDDADTSRQAFIDGLSNYYRKADAYSQLANQVNDQSYTQWAQESAAQQGAPLLPTAGAPGSLMPSTTAGTPLLPGVSVQVSPNISNGLPVASSTQQPAAPMAWSRLPTLQRPIVQALTLH